MAQKLRTVGVIPARLGSQRLPRKVLREIQGKLLVEWVYVRASEAEVLDELYVATDSKEVFEACKKRNLPVLLTSDEHRSGTDRIYEVNQTKRADLYVNIQGDEPLVRREHLEALIKPFSHSKEIQVTTLKTKISKEEASNPNVVKVVTDLEGRALYFSRSVIPFDRNTDSSARARRASPLQAYFKHLGFYAYTAEALEKFHRLPPSPLEQTEKLEQLRFLENGIPLFVAETEFDTIGVDTEEDFQRAAKALTKEANAPKTLRAGVSTSGRKQGD